MRKLLALLVVVGVFALYWSGRSFFKDDDDLRAIMVFDQKEPLSRGDVVLHGGAVIGHVRSVSNVDGRTTAVVDVETEHRNALRSDSLVRVIERGHRSAIEVDSNFAVGRPLEDGAVLRARDHQFAQWLEKGRDSVAPAAKRLRDSASTWISSESRKQMDRQLDEWTARIPQWKAEGREALEKRVDAAKRKADEWERSLRDAGRAEDAQHVRERFSRWLREIRSEEKDG